MPTIAQVEQWHEWLDTIEKNGVGLTPWEESFIDSMRDKFDMYGARVIISDTQAAALEKIYNERVP